MTILTSIIGFISGFCAGQMLLMFLLRHKSNEELKANKSLKIYGLLNWLIAVAGALASVLIYRKYFG